MSPHSIIIITLPHCLEWAGNLSSTNLQVEPVRDFINMVNELNGADNKIQQNTDLD